MQRRQFTVVGDTVNFASRLESATKDLGVELLLSEDAANHVRDSGGGTGLIALPPIEVRGRPGQHVVYGVPARG